MRNQSDEQLVAERTRLQNQIETYGRDYNTNTECAKLLRELEAVNKELWRRLPRPGRYGQ